MKEVNLCSYCDSFDSDKGCTMPSYEKKYACPYENGEYENAVEYLKEKTMYTINFLNKGLTYKEETELRNIMDNGCNYGQIILWFMEKERKFKKEYQHE